MSEEEKEETSSPEEKPSSEEAPEAPSAEAPKTPKPPPPPPPPAVSPRKEETMIPSHKEGAGNFLAMMAIAVALGSLLLTAFFAYAKARPSSDANWALKFQRTTTQEINTLTARIIDLEAAVQELKSQGGSTGEISTLDLKKSLVSLREVGRQASGETRKRVQQVEGALKALINELEAKGQ
jgi:uncharacterized protein HemX